MYTPWLQVRTVHLHTGTTKTEQIWFSVLYVRLALETNVAVSTKRMTNVERSAFTSTTKSRIVGKKGVKNKKSYPETKVHTRGCVADTKNPEEI